MNTRTLGLLAIAALGIALIVAGVTSGVDPHVFPDRIRADSPTHRRLTHTLDLLEAAARDGDLARVRSLVDPQWLAGLEARIEALGGGTLDPMKLHEQFGFVGSLDAWQFSAGVGSGPRAAVAYVTRRARRDGLRRMQVFVFAAADGRVLLADKRTRTLRLEDSAVDASRRFCEELLADER